MKVVRLLQDMSVELNQELEDDKQVHEKYSCWCETNEKEKTQAIELGEAKISEMKSTMDEAVAKLMGLKEKRKVTMEEINGNHASLSQASTIRMTENKAFQGEETDLLEAVAACKQAIVVLSKHNPQFAQMRSIARVLGASRVQQLALSSGSLRKHQMDMLKEFLGKASGTESFLTIPGFRSYAPQSGQIFGILKQMQADFESRLSDTQKAEQKASDDYNALKAAKEEEITAGKKTVVQIDADLAEFSEKHAQAAQELEDAQAQLELDTTFLANLKAKCSESKEEYDTRVKARLDEIAAVEDTIKILNSDKAFDIFDKSVNSFLQISVTYQTERKNRARAVSVLRQAAQATASPKLALLASRAQLDAFTKVKEEIDKLVAELGKQQTDEVAHRDFCIKDMNTNGRDTAAAEDKKAALEVKSQDLGKTIELLTADISAAKSATLEIQTQMKRASENREAENSDFQQTIADQRLTQMILQKAVNRMKQVYALVQQPGAAHIATSGNHTDPGNEPARFTEYGQNAGGARVVAFLEKIISDSKKTEDDAIASADDSQTAYKNFMKDSNKAIVKYSESISHMSEAAAKAKASLTMAKTDLKQTVEELGDLSDTLGDLHKSCDFILKNFEARQAARLEEMDALKQAKAILSGMK